jgi:hypothetical protein
MIGLLLGIVAVRRDLGFHGLLNRPYNPIEAARRR